MDKQDDCRMAPDRDIGNRLPGMRAPGAEERYIVAVAQPGAADSGIAVVDFDTGAAAAASDTGAVDFDMGAAAAAFDTGAVDSDMGAAAVDIAAADSDSGAAGSDSAPADSGIAAGSKIDSDAAGFGQS
ncbi:MAG: hypothetical protein ABSB50_10965 [Terracidiphilus sp.]